MTGVERGQVAAQKKELFYFFIGASVRSQPAIRSASELKLMMTLVWSAPHDPGLLSRPEEDLCSEHNEVRPR